MLQHATETAAQRRCSTFCFLTSFPVAASFRAAWVWALVLGRRITWCVCRFCNAKCRRGPHYRSAQAVASRKLEQAFMVLMYHSTSHIQQAAWVVFLVVVVIDYAILSPSTSFRVSVIGRLPALLLALSSSLTRFAPRNR